MPLELRKLVEAFDAEPFVANRQDLIDNQDVRIDVNGDREAQPHIHPGRVGFHRGINEGFEFREPDDFVETFGDLPLAESKHDAVDEDVLATRNLGVKACAQLDER